MAAELPYLPSAKNLQILFAKIKTAKTPDAFTQNVLSQTFGLKSTSDRPLIGILKKLGFLDQSAKPSATYSLLKNDRTAGAAIAQGIHAAYEPLFTANEKAHELNGSELKGLVAQVSGADDRIVQAVTYTFSALVKLADFKGTGIKKAPDEKDNSYEHQEDDHSKKDQGGLTSLKGGFHFNLQVHLPSNASEETYINIFSALRKVFK